MPCQCTYVIYVQVSVSVCKEALVFSAYAVKLYKMQVCDLCSSPALSLLICAM